MDLGTKCYSLVFVLAAAACGSVVQPNDVVSGDDANPDAPPQDDVEPTPDGGPAEPPPDGPLTIATLPTQIADERGDVVTFSNGAPRHQHAGAAIELGAAFSCPEVFKYGYLLDENPPATGAEVARNPLAFRFRTTGAQLADYRVRLGDATVRDWTPGALVGGELEVVLHRDGAHGVTQLSSIAGRYFVDVRARNAGGQEVTTSTCWEHRPLAAPIQVDRLAPAVRPGSLSTFSLADDSRISQLVEPGAGVLVFENRFVHATTEPVTVRIAVPAAPTATYTATIANDVVTTSTTETVPCGTTCTTTAGCTPVPVTDPRCFRPDPEAIEDPIEAPQSGNLTLAWRLQVVDAAGQPSALCTIDGLSATCQLPARAPNAPLALAVQLIASGATELFPPGGAGEHTFLGLGYTGQPVTITGFFCNQQVRTPNGPAVINTCARYTTFHRLIAIDEASVSFDGPAIEVKAGAGAALAPVPYLPSTLPGSPLTWNAGNDDLPGSN